MTAKGKLVTGGVLFFIVLGLLVESACTKPAAGAAGPADVEVLPVEQKDVPIYGEWIGTLDGLVNADVRAQVSGYLMKQGYQEGGMLAASAFGIFFVPPIFYVVEKWSSAGKQPASGSLPSTPATAEGD